MHIGRTIPPAAAPVTSKDIINGFNGFFRGQAAIDRLLSELEGYFQTRYCFLISSGRAALALILKALHNRAPGRDEVLIPAFTCYSVPSAIVRAGLKVRLCDVDPETLDFDFAKLGTALNDQRNLLAVVSPHLFGLPADIGTLRGCIQDPEITIIDDAAQAMGSAAKGGFLGKLGDVGFFSLGRGKVLTTVEGGIIVTDSNGIGKRIESMIQKIPGHAFSYKLKLTAYALALSVFMPPALFWIPKSLPGLNLGETVYDPGFPVRRFSNFQAGLARHWQQRILSMQESRRQNVRYWSRALDRYSWLQKIRGEDEAGKELPLIRFPVLTRNRSLRSAVLTASERYGLGLMPSYPDAIDGITALEISGSGRSHPGAKECAGRLITFPVHGYVTRKDRERIVNRLDNIRADTAGDLKQSTDS